MDVQTKVAGTTGSAVGLSAIAAFIGLCCIGPWSVALFGVSGAITMARFDFLRPYILSAAAVMLGWAFWRVYRPQPVCADGACALGPRLDSQVFAELVNGYLKETGTSPKNKGSNLDLT